MGRPSSGFIRGNFSRLIRLEEYSYTQWPYIRYQIRYILRTTTSQRLFYLAVELEWCDVLGYSLLPPSLSLCLLSSEEQPRARQTEPRMLTTIATEPRVSCV